MIKNIEKNLYWFYFVAFALILVLPLASVPPLLHPPSFAKSIIFRIILSLVVLAFVYQNLFLNKEKFSEIKKSFNLKSKLFAPLILLIILGFIYILATIFSLEKNFSLWGSPARGGGSITFLFLIAFSILIAFIIKKKDWQKLWDVSIIAGILVSLIAIFQKFNIFGQVLVRYENRPISTMGGPIFLSLYLLLLIFPTVSFLIKNRGLKRIFYSISLILFFSAIILAATRAVFLGIALATIFFIFFYPQSANRRNKRIFIAKISIGVLMVVSLIFAFWLGGKPETVKKIETNPVIGVAFQRIWDVAEPILNIKEISFVKIVTPERYSGWQTLWQGLKERPILGYGPENVSIPFDKYYDPRTPGITSQVGEEGQGGWWDRAHNILLDMAITIGIPGLIIYLLLLLFIFLKLNKIKAQRPLTIHGLQAAFIAYFTANLFSFDLFSTYLMFFFLIGYSLFIIKKAQDNNETKENNKSSQNTLWHYILFTILIFAFIWFLWAENIKPLSINKKLNIAIALSEDLECDAALQVINPLLLEHSFIDNYIRLKYIDIISSCIKNYPPEEQKIQLSHKAVSLLKEAKKLRPTYTRSWLYSAVYLNRTIELDNSLTDEQKKEIAQEALYNLEKTDELSPKRIQATIAEIKTHLLIGELDKALAKIEECMTLDNKSPNCYWAKALLLVAKGQEKSEETLQLIKTAADMSASAGYSVQNKSSISQLIKLYISFSEKNPQDLEYYEILAELYKELIEIEYTNFQNHASLAYTYAVLGQYDKARQEAEIVLQLSPESEPNVKAFLDSLPE